MADTVKIPGLKQPLPKWGVVAGLGGVGVAVVIYYRNKNAQSTAAAAAPSSTDQYPPDGTVGDPSDPYSTDPATGQTYGDEAIGSGGTFGAFSGDLGGFGGTGWDPSTGMYTDPNGNTCTNPGADGYCPGSGGGPPFSTNDAWSLWVIQQEQTLNPNVNVGQLTDALGLYLAGDPVDTAQKTLVLDAEAIGGPPPVAGPNGYPPNVRLNGNKGGGGNAQNPVSGLRASVRFTQVDLSWNAAKNATSYRVIVKDSKNRQQTQSSTSPHITLHNLAKKDKYTVQVLALPADKTAYAHEARTEFETK